MSKVGSGKIQVLAYERSINTNPIHFRFFSCSWERPFESIKLLIYTGNELSKLFTLEYGQIREIASSNEILCLLVAAILLTGVCVC